MAGLKQGEYFFKRGGDELFRVLHLSPGGTLACSRYVSGPRRGETVDLHVLPGEYIMVQKPLALAVDDAVERADMVESAARRSRLSILFIIGLGILVQGLIICSIISLKLSM